MDAVVPAAQLSPLRATYCGMEYGPMLRAGRSTVGFFRDLAPLMAREHDIRYPTELERLMTERLDGLATSAPPTM